MNGSDAVVFAFEDSDVKMVTGVPGYPVTDLMVKPGKKIRHEWSVNEKVALELALGSSICTERSAVITKHVGMNILADPLVTSSTHTIGAGIVIIAGDDPGARKSQNEQDSRFYGLLAEVPVFDPSTPQALYTSIQEGFRLSEEVSSPVIIRITDRLLESEGRIHKKGKSGPFASFDKKIWQLTMMGKHQRFHKESFSAMCEHAERSKLNTCKKKGSALGIISSGFLTSIVDSVINGDQSHLSLGVVVPLPVDLVNRFINQHERILVVEETEPVIERQLGKRALGKLTGHIPYGMVEKEDILQAIENIGKDTVSRNVEPQKIEQRGAHPLCEDCPYLALYQAIKELNVPVAGDMGCSILTSSPPMYLLDAAFSLCSSIGTASGFNQKGIALIGDYGLAHSGIQGLINAVQNKHELVIIVLQNKVAAMTGGQEVPDLTELVRSYIKDTEIIYPETDTGIKALLEARINAKGISLILARARCPRY
jgi:indolepyruvate ferredoxin oxidoreductase alpha subunit